MALKKSELYSSLWSSCDQLRGGMDASQYKDYVLTLLFMKYMTDKHAGQPSVIRVPEGGSFADMVKVRGDKEIGEKINIIINRFAEANDLRGVIGQADFNDDHKLGQGKEMQDRLSELVGIFEELDFRSNRADGDDLLGDAYEYLMRNFATESGKSKGQFYTPAEVSRVMAKVVGVGQATSQDQALYDPTCGSGSLLLKAADEAPHNITIYGQEMDNATWALATMNMFLHDQSTAEIWRGNTLADPYWKNPDGGIKTFDFAVANPPFSTKAWSNGLDPEHDQYRRFAYGVPPQKNGDYAFLLHILTSLKSAGKAAVVLPHGVLFRGNAEAEIRRNLVRRGFIKAIIGLPPNLFYGTGIPACIVVVDKEHAQTRSSIFFIDASKGFMKDGNKNRLRARDIRKIVDVYDQRLNLPGYSRDVSLEEIERNDFNLNIPRYIDGQAPEDIQDIGGHLRGGIPAADIDALSWCWDICPRLRETLFRPNRPGYLDLAVDPADIKDAIHDDPDFAGLIDDLNGYFTDWRRKNEPKLKALTAGCRPKEVIGRLSEDLLERYSGVPLIDRYDIYQRLMDYWDETMQDDCYAIAADGWRAIPERILEPDKKGKLKDKGWSCDLIPKSLIVARYFPERQAEVDRIAAELEGVSAELSELEEEQRGEDGVFADLGDDKVTQRWVNQQRRELSGLFSADNPEAAEQVAILDRWLALSGQEARLKKELKEAESSLDADAFAKYPKLSQDEIKSLVVDGKWFAALSEAVQSEIDRLSEQLTQRVRTLAERYATPLPELSCQVEALEAKVNCHFEQMGFRWS